MTSLAITTMTSLAMTTMVGHGPLLAAHTVVGILVFLLAFAAIFIAVARRLVLYALIVQILLGAATMGMTGLRPPVLHWVLALFVGGLYAMANAAERRGRPASVVRTMLVVAALIVAFIYYLGEHTLHPG